MSGRKSKYQSHVLPNLERIPKWRRDGLTEEQICKKLDVGVSNFNRYKGQYEELREALKRGREELIEELEDSLYKRAMGFEYDEVEQWIEMYAGQERKKVRKLRKVALPDTGAIAFALKNLATDKWREMRAVDHSGGLTNHNVVEVKDGTDIMSKIDKYAEMFARLEGEECDEEQGLPEGQVAGDGTG